MLKAFVESVIAMCWARARYDLQFREYAKIFWDRPQCVQSNEKD